MKKYKTKSGTYAEDELAVVIWTNPKTKTSRQSRPLETMTAENSRLPMAFPLSSFKSNKSWQRAKIVHDPTELFDLLQASSRSAPLIVPLNVAKRSLGWENFYVPSEYTTE